MQAFVLGFVFSLDLKRILLIRKNRPAAFKDLWNGIGGKVEPGESPINAMVREAREEAGLDVPLEYPSSSEAFKVDLILQGCIKKHHSDTWQRFATMTNDECRIHVYRAFHENLDEAKQATDEEVRIFDVADLGRLPVVPGVVMLASMALCFHLVTPVHLEFQE